MPSLAEVAHRLPLWVVVKLMEEVTLPRHPHGFHLGGRLAVPVDAVASPDFGDDDRFGVKAVFHREIGAIPEVVRARELPVGMQARKLDRDVRERRVPHAKGLRVLEASLDLAKLGVDALD